MKKNNTKYAVVLFNLGGPDCLKSVKPFLFNLFFDKAIIPLPSVLRFLIAFFISTLRLKKSQGIYSKMGGKSPILEQTISQEKALENKLLEHINVKVFTIMRYWHPRAKDVIKNILEYNPEKIILLPLYPQYSTTTTQSSFDEWFELFPKNLHIETKKIDDYFDHKDFIEAHCEMIKPFLEEAKKFGRSKILFSAHSLPQRVVDAGDPYQKQIELSVKKIMENFSDTDFEICYQSKVGKMKWLEPSVEYTMKKTVQSCKSIVVVPIAFVSEHSETLVELDMDFKDLAKSLNFAYYGRVPALSCNLKFIECLKNLVLEKTNNWD